MKKKFLTVALSAMLAVTAVAGLSACSEEGDVKFEAVAKEDIKIGMIALHDESSTYDKNFIEAMYRAVENKGLKKDQLKLVTGIPETSECYDKAKNLVNQGCQVIFADSFGHEDFMIQAAEEYKNVRFCHATGTKAHSLKYSNFSNAFAAIYEGRYLAGIAAGMKLDEIGSTAADHVMGYVGAFPYAEVVSGYTSFYLGAKSVCPDVTMKVRYTGSWYDTDKEHDTADTLIKKDGCKLISQHADSYGAPNACEENNVPNVSYNGSTKAQGPNTYIVSSRINWTPYFEYMIDCVLNGENIAHDWTGTIATGSVEIIDLNEEVAAEGTKAALEEAKGKLKAGTLSVFNLDSFTVGGKKVADDHKADVDTDDKFTPDTEVIENGVFMESKFRSAPYFDLRIDGITEIQDK